jgi:serine/threonine-protein kinase RsbW
MTIAATDLGRPQLERRVFPGRPEQVACARRFISRVLTRCPAAADAVLLTSELVTNTVLHTVTGHGGDFEIIACHGPAAVRVTVTDGGSRSGPELVPQAELGTSGRGLALVGALAARWGHHGSERGRAVWFELDCR